MTGAPDSMVVEVEFTAGVWTDVSTYVDWSAGGTTKYGRSSQFSAPQAATLTLTLDNTDGRFSPLRQTLADGVTAHPYYPNVVPRKRIRFGYVIAGTRYYRFTGYIKGWPPFLKDGWRPRVLINATDRSDRFAKVNLSTPIRQELAVAATPALYWPLTDASGSTSAADQSGQSSIPSLALAGQSTAPLAFGVDGPATSDGSAVQLSPTASATGQLLELTSLDKYLDTTKAWSFVIAYNAGTALPSWAAGIGGVGLATLASLTTPNGSLTVTELPLSLNTSGQIVAQSPGPLGILSGSTSRLDGGWHTAVLSSDALGNVTLYDDGVSLGSVSVSPAQTFNKIRVGDYAGQYTPSRYSGRVAHVALYQSALTAAQAASIAGSVTGFAGELNSARVARLLGYAGLTSSDLNVDTSTVVCGSYPQSGRDVLSACQDAATTEGAGSVFYIGTDGRARFTSRRFLAQNTVPALTVSNEGDLAADPFLPAFDDTQIVNQVTGTRSTATDSPSSQTVYDTTSEGTFGITSDTLTSYAASDADVLYNAQDELARRRTPAYRVPQATVDLYTAATAGLYAAVGNTELGERLRITGLPVQAAPATQLDFIVEGWADTFSDSGYSVMFDLSAADVPPEGVADDATYGRAQASGMTLNGALTAAATTLSVATTAGLPTFSTTAGSYPLTIKVDEEQMTVTAAPAASTSPQTLTVTRGVNGTTAAAHASGTAVNVYPAAAASL